MSGFQWFQDIVNSINCQMLLEFSYIEAFCRSLTAYVSHQRGATLNSKYIILNIMSSKLIKMIKDLTLNTYTLLPKCLFQEKQPCVVFV